MYTLPIGILAVILVTYFSLDTENLGIYLNQHSFIIVGLGTVAVFLFSIPRKDIVLTFKSIKDLFQKDKDEKAVKSILMELSKGNKKSVKADLPLIKYAIGLWEQGTDKENFEFLMHEKFDELNRISEQPVQILRNLSKYPPALGMTGTVMGMISLFANLSSENKSDVGPALALAMTATFYGLIMANMIMLPLADRIHAKHLSVMNRNESVLNAILKINDNEPASLIESMNIEQEYFEHAG